MTMLLVSRGDARPAEGASPAPGAGDAPAGGRAPVATVCSYADAVSPARRAAPEGVAVARARAERPSAGRTLLIDNYDSFTYNLYHMLCVEAAHFGETIVVTNDAYADWAGVLRALGPFERVVLSPGPGHPARAADFGLCAHALRCAGVPILGVCLGHQGIGVHCGARVLRAAVGPRHGMLERVRHDGSSALLRGVPHEFTVVRYHSLEIEKASLPPCLRAVALASDGTVMAVEHCALPLYGMQFHPESVHSEHGHAMLRNFAAQHAPRTRAHAPPRALPAPRPTPSQPDRAASDAPCAECAADGAARAPPPPAGAAARSGRASGGARAGAQRAGAQRAGAQRAGAQRVLLLVDRWAEGDADGPPPADLADAFVALHAHERVAWWLDSSSRAAEPRGGAAAAAAAPAGRAAADAELPPADTAGAMAARFSFAGGLGGPLAHVLALDCAPAAPVCVLCASGSGGGGGGVRCACACAGGGARGAVRAGAEGVLGVARAALGAYALDEARDVRGWDDGAPTALPWDALRGGYVGYVGYEARHDPALAHGARADARGGAGGGASAAAAPPARAPHVPDVCMVFADRFVALDHDSGSLYLCHLVRAAEGGGACAADAAEAARWRAATRAAVRGSGGAAAAYLRAHGVQPLDPRARAAAAAAAAATAPAPPPPPAPAAAAAPPPPCAPAARFVPAQGVQAYVRAVRACLGAIRAGESYELCLTQQLRAEAPQRRGGGALPPLALYLTLRATNPAPNGAFYRVDPAGALEGCARAPALPPRAPALAVCCSSPERLLRVCARTAAAAAKELVDDEGVPFGADASAPPAPGCLSGRVLLAESKPIKGTAPRGATRGADRLLALALGASAKERAENLMIADLVRNDLARVSVPGCVRVPALLRVESYRSVHQLVSTVRAPLGVGLGALDALGATFPGGSMTGAPKLRTMELIHAIERGAPRGVYSGALGCLSLGGTADLAIVIRTAVCTPAGVHVGAGGAITALSCPEAEHAEMVLKATAVMRALAHCVAGSLDAFELAEHEEDGADEPLPLPFADGGGDDPQQQPAALPSPSDCSSELAAVVRPVGPVAAGGLALGPPPAVPRAPVAVAAGGGGIVQQESS